MEKLVQTCPKCYKTFKRSDHFETHIKYNKFFPTFIEPLAANFESTLTDIVESNFGEALEVNFESTLIDNNDAILCTLARGDHIANTEENIVSSSNSKNDSSFRFRQHKRRMLFKIDNLLQGVELQQKEKIISSVIQISNFESTINTNVMPVFEGKVVIFLIEYFKILANSKQYSALFKFITDIFVDELENSRFFFWLNKRIGVKLVLDLTFGREVANREEIKYPQICAKKVMTYGLKIPYHLWTVEMVGNLVTVEKLNT